MFCYDEFWQHFTILRLCFNVWQLSPKGDQMIWAWSIMICFLWMKPKLVWTDPPLWPKAPKLIPQLSISAWTFFILFWFPLLKEEVFILPGLTTNGILYSHGSESILSWKGPTNFKVRPKEVSSFIWLFLLLAECSHSLCQALGLSWPKSVFWPHKVLPKHFLLGYQLLCLATSFKVSVSAPSAQPASPSSSQICRGSPCCFGHACLAAPLMPVPKLKQSLLPLLPSLCCCLAEQTQACVQPQSKQEQGWAHRDAVAQEPHWAAGRAGLCQDGAAWRQGWFKAAEGGTAGCAATAHSSSLTSDHTGLQPSCWIWRGREVTKPFLWTLSSLLTLCQGPRRGTLDTSTVPLSREWPAAQCIWPISAHSNIPWRPHCHGQPHNHWTSGLFQQLYLTNYYLTII